jgi:hypothetical protein
MSTRAQMETRRAAVEEYARKKAMVTIMTTKAETLARRSAVDEYGDLVAELAPFKGKQTRCDELAKTIRSWYVDSDAGTTYAADGDRFVATLGAKGNQTVIDIAAAYKALGAKKFKAAVTLTMKALEAALPAALVLLVTSKEQTGTRSLQVSAATPCDIVISLAA